MAAPMSMVLANSLSILSRRFRPSTLYIPSVQVQAGELDMGRGWNLYIFTHRFTRRNRIFSYMNSGNSGRGSKCCNRNTTVSKKCPRIIACDILESYDKDPTFSHSYRFWQAGTTEGQKLYLLRQHHSITSTGNHYPYAQGITFRCGHSARYVLDAKI